MVWRTLPFALICALPGGATEAHHSIAAIYDASQRKTIEGVVAEFHFVNPHPRVLIDVKDDSGRPARWRLEMDNRRELAQAGFGRETIKPGDYVIVAGSPARGQALDLYIRRLDRPSDGFWYEQVGGTPRIGSR